MNIWRSSDGSMELRLGDWREVLADVTECEAIIVDAPYFTEVHAGHNTAPTVTERRDKTSPYKRGTHDRAVAGSHRKNGGVEGAHRDGKVRRAIDYEGWTPVDVGDFVNYWSVRCGGWVVSITDHVLARAWADSMAENGRYVFAPLPWFAPGSRVRLTGDGPSSWTCWIVVGRPSRDLRTGRTSGATFPDGTPSAKWGTLPGGYMITSDSNSIVVGAKPLGLMCAIVRDYSRPGDLIVDPCAGGGTSLLAAAMEGRRAIGAEIDPETFEKAVARLSRGYTRDMFA